MKNILNSIKSTVNKVFKKEEPVEIETKTPESAIESTSFNKGPVNPGLEETREDVGKKVFEKTGRSREGVGQSSTRLEPQEFPVKTNQGDKNRRPYNKKYQKYHKKKNGSQSKKENE